MSVLGGASDNNHYEKNATILGSSAMHVMAADLVRLQKAAHRTRTVRLLSAGWIGRSDLHPDAKSPHQSRVCLLLCYDLASGTC